MASVAIDHMLSLILLLGAMTVFINLFSQSIQTAILYQSQRAVSLKCSDLLDNILLTLGTPPDWGQTNDAPTTFGLQAPESSQSSLSPFSLMRLAPQAGNTLDYSRTNTLYSYTKVAFGESLYVPVDKTVSYNTALKLLGINGTHGFQLTIAPTISVSITELQLNPLNLAIDVTGVGSSLANAEINYNFMDVSIRADGYPAHTIIHGNTTTNKTGSTTISLPSFNGTTDSYALIVYAKLNGLVGVGYHSRVLYDADYAVPLVSDFGTKQIIMAHSWDTNGGTTPSAITFNSTFAIPAKDFTLREITVANATSKIVGTLDPNGSSPFYEFALDSDNPGILVTTYGKSGGSTEESGIVVMPWGFGALPFWSTFGGDPTTQSSVATDIRQVTINGIAYQVKLSLWSSQEYQVIN